MRAIFIFTIYQNYTSGLKRRYWNTGMIYWNDLPLTVRQSSSVSTFRKALKHIFLKVCNCNIYLTTCMYL